MGYRSDAMKGITWMSLLRGLTRLLTFFRLAVLGRLLTPVEFGYFGIASILLAFLEILTETGINVFLVQEKSYIKDYIDSAWIVSIVRGLVLSVAIFLLAPIIVTFFKSPQAIYVVQLTAIIPLIRGFINPAIITYQKELLFHREFLFRSLLFVIEITFSIIAGFITKSAESFTYGLIASAIVEVILSYALLPIRPQIHFEFDKIKHVVKRGWWITLTGISLYFGDNGDNITVGKLFGSGTLGIYQIAYKFSTLPITEITQVVNQVMFPVYTKFTDDPKRLLRALLKVTGITSLGAIFLGTIVYIFAEPIILLFMGDQWLSAVPAIKILSIYGVLRTMFGNVPPLFLAVKKQDYVLYMTFSRLIGLLIFIYPLSVHYGMVGAGIAMLISMFFEVPVIIYCVYKLFRVI